VDVIGTSLISGRSQIRVPRRRFRFMSTSMSMSPVGIPQYRGAGKTEQSFGNGLQQGTSSFPDTPADLLDAGVTRLHQRDLPTGRYTVSELILDGNAPFGCLHLAESDQRE
jgi:hypothetical protein